MAFFQRLINKIAENMPVVKTGMKSSMTLPGVILRGKDWGESTKVHEQIHAQQQIKDPFFYIRYALSDKYRWRVEKEAYAAEMQNRLSHNLTFDWPLLRNALLHDYYNMASAQEIDQFINQLKAFEERKRNG